MKKAPEGRIDWVALSPLELFIAAEMYTSTKMNFKFFTSFLSFRLYLAYHFDSHTKTQNSFSIIKCFTSFPYALNNNETMCKLNLVGGKNWPKPVFSFEIQNVKPLVISHLRQISNLSLTEIYLHNHFLWNFSDSWFIAQLALNLVYS